MRPQVIEETAEAWTVEVRPTWLFDSLRRPDAVQERAAEIVEGATVTRGRRYLGPGWLVTTVEIPRTEGRSRNDAEELAARIAETIDAGAP